MPKSKAKAASKASNPTTKKTITEAPKPTPDVLPPSCPTEQPNDHPVPGFFEKVASFLFTPFDFDYVIDIVAKTIAELNEEVYEDNANGHL